MLKEQLKSHLLNLYNMVLADDTVRSEELLKLYQIAKRHGIEEEELRATLISPAHFMVPDNLEDKVRYLYELTEILLADGVVAEGELMAMKHFCLRFGFDENNIDAITNYMIESVKQEKGIMQIMNEINA